MHPLFAKKEEGQVCLVFFFLARGEDYDSLLVLSPQVLNFCSSKCVVSRKRRAPFFFFCFCFKDFTSSFGLDFVGKFGGVRLCALVRTSHVHVHTLGCRQPNRNSKHLQHILLFIFVCITFQNRFDIIDTFMYIIVT